MLIGLAAGSLPISGCAIIGDLTTRSGLSTEEQQLLQEAMSQNDPVLVERYLRKYPPGRVQSLLNAQNPEVLSRLSSGAFGDVPDNVLKRLPQSILTHLPPDVVARIEQTTSNRGGSDDRSEDSYSG